MIRLDNNPPAPSPPQNMHHAKSIRAKVVFVNIIRAFHPLTMLEGLLLLVSILVMSESINIQAHVPGNAALSSSLREACLRVHNRLATLGRLHKFGVLLLEDGKIPLRLPIPDTVSGE